MQQGQPAREVRQVRRSSISPKIVGELNDHQVKVVKVQGEFVWHHHENEDELFLVVKGRMRMGLRDGDIELAEGEIVHRSEGRRAQALGRARSAGSS